MCEEENVYMLHLCVHLFFVLSARRWKKVCVRRRMCVFVCPLAWWWGEGSECPSWLSLKPSASCHAGWGWGAPSSSCGSSAASLSFLLPVEEHKTHTEGLDWGLVPHNTDWGFKVHVFAYFFNPLWRRFLCLRQRFNGLHQWDEWLERTYMCRHNRMDFCRVGPPGHVLLWPGRLHVLVFGWALSSHTQPQPACLKASTVPRAPARSPASSYSPAYKYIWAATKCLFLLCSPTCNTQKTDRQTPQLCQMISNRTQITIGHQSRAPHLRKWQSWWRTGYTARISSKILFIGTLRQCP